MDLNGRSITTLKSGDTAVVTVQVYFHQPVHGPIFALTIRSSEGQLVYDTTSLWQAVQTPDFSRDETVQIVYRLELPLLNGQYDLGVDLAAADLSHDDDRLEHALSFTIWETPQAKGLIDLTGQFRHCPCWVAWGWFWSGRGKRGT